MKIIKTFILFFIPVILFSGCLKVETKLIVNKDGSGRINETVLMSKTFVNMINSFAQSFSDSTEPEQQEFSLFDEEKLKNSAGDYGEGVRYVSGEKVSNEGWEGFRAVYTFSDLNKIKIEPDPDEKVDLGMSSEETTGDEEYYYFKFIPGDVPEVIINRPDIEADLSVNKDETEQQEEGDGELGEEFLQMMEGMKVSVAVQFEGDIIETNATYVEGSEITLVEMELSEMMKNKEEFKKFKEKEPENLDEMKEFVDKFPGMKIEFNKPVTVKFK